MDTIQVTTIDGTTHNIVITINAIDDVFNLISGTGGNDTLYGTAGQDEIYGYGGNGSIYGDDSYDKIYGGSGNDILDGGAGSDSLLGGVGDDILIFDVNDLSIYGNSGTDTLLIQGGVYLSHHQCITK